MVTAIENFDSLKKYKERLAQYRIKTVEDFYSRAYHNREGMEKALGVDTGEIDRLLGEAENILGSAEVQRLQEPVKKHPRGALIP